MSGIDWVELSKIAPSIVVMFVYAVFTERMRREHQTSILALINQWNTSVKEMMEQERNARRESTTRLAEEIKELVIAITKLTTLMLEHDRRLEQGITKMETKVEEFHKLIRMGQ